MTTTAVAAAPPGLRYACPRCHHAVEPSASAYECTSCASRYPVVMGIPDFRVFPDPWIGFEADREKARRLVEQAGDASLETMVRTYWAMTPGTPTEQARRFIDHVLTAPARSREWLDGLAASGPGPWLDIGTGTGDLAVLVAQSGRAVVAIDVAMRWLVVARRRAELANVPISIVCANAEHLPFAPDQFVRIVSLGTLEHCANAPQAVREMRRVLVRHGDVRLRTVNRYALTPEPHVGIWGVGFVPRRFADRFVRLRGGSGYRHHRPLSPREVRVAMRRAGFRGVRVDAAPLLAAERAKLGPLAPAAAGYERARRAWGSRVALRWVAPLLEASGEAS